MKKLYFFFIVWGLMISLFSACSDDDDYIPTLPIVGFAQGNYSMELTDSIVFRAEVTNALENTFSWALDNDEVSTGDTYVFKAENSGTYQLALTAKNSDGTTTKTATITVNPGKYKNGTFILNEGLVTTHGSLIYISPEGDITPNVYYKVNGEYLGDVCQDLYIKNNKMYIVSQNGGNGGGFLTICNAETLKKERSFHDPFILGIDTSYYEDEGKMVQVIDTTFSYWPTHIAILGDDDIYIRDNRNGIFLMHPSTVANDHRATLIKGTQGARKNTMAVAEGKLFASRRNTVIVIERGKNEVAHTIAFGKKQISGLIKATDGNLWASDEGGIIYKIDPKSYEILAQNQLEGEAASLLRIRASQPAAPNITAKGDTIYISNTTTTIYRHIFSTNETKYTIDAKNWIPASSDFWEGNYASKPLVYNTCAVHPITGEVFLNTVKGIGSQRHTNHITIFDFSRINPESENYARISRDYANYTDYPANVFFTYNFK